VIEQHLEGQHCQRRGHRADTTASLILAELAPALGRANGKATEDLGCGGNVLETALTSQTLFSDRDQLAVLPPLILTIWPVMKDALSEARNTMASAISSGFPPRLSGTAA
jgi:hypothetical protein